MDERSVSYKYVGSELELFAGATHWKNYFGERLTPFIGQRVLEVGAGLGGTTRVLCTGRHDIWVCLEPDDSLIASLKSSVASGELPACCEPVSGMLPNPLVERSSFDTVLYIDVLEHIETDREELETALSYLRRGGNLIVLSPAHNWLFSPFDAALGHFRRYSKKSLSNLTPAGSELIRIEYLDSVGLFASLANRLFLKQQQPTIKQVHFWDRRMVPISRRVDPVLGRKVGKSILAVWRKM